MTIVANAARTRRVVAARHLTLTLDAEPALSVDDAAQSPEARAIAMERRREVLRAVSSLRMDDQQVIACRYFLDLSVDETAALLGCARGTVKSRLSRALGRLRQHLQQTGGARTAAGGECHD